MSSLCGLKEEQNRTIDEKTSRFDQILKQQAMDCYKQCYKKSSKFLLQILYSYILTQTLILFMSLYLCWSQHSFWICLNMYSNLVQCTKKNFKYILMMK